MLLKINEQLKILISEAFAQVYNNIEIANDINRVIKFRKKMKKLSCKSTNDGFGLIDSWKTLFSINVKMET